jgi:integrase
MGRQREKGTGTITKASDGRFVVRLRWRDENGERRGIRRVYPTRTDAKEALDAFNRERERVGPTVLETERKTFADLADLFERTYCTEPVYRDGRKVSGMRSRADALSRLAVLRAHFSRRRVRDITHADIVAFKAKRLATPTRFERARSVATVNRDLAILRRVLNVAVGERWIATNPFAGSTPLISAADERKRERVLSLDEEARLLAACTGKRAHLRPLIIVALDTGCRRGELLRLTWEDVDLLSEPARLRVLAENSKTQRERSVPLTQRAAAALAALQARPATTPEARCFGVTSSPKTAWRGACRAAGLVDLRFHDLRTTCGTRLSGAGVPIAEVARMLGHSDTKTTFRFYIGEAEGSLNRAAAALDRLHRDILGHDEAEERVN